MSDRDEPLGGNRFIRPAYGITRLFHDVNNMAPYRTTTHDGILGDQRHAAEHSGHNPNIHGIACAGDITNDPAHGCDSHEVAESVRLSHDKRVLYVISRGHIFDGYGGTQPFVWRPYNGSSPHIDHAHFSLLQDPHYYDNSSPWEVEAMPSAEEIAAALLNHKLPGVPDDPGGENKERTVGDMLRQIEWAVFAIKKHLGA